MLIGPKGGAALGADAPMPGARGAAAPTARIAARARRGASNHAAGLAAEEAVAATYLHRGLGVAARRWRAPHARAEIDLVLRDGAGCVFVEVKRAATHDVAAAALGAGQAERLLAAGAEWLGREPRGLDTPARFDLATVDAAGTVRVLENAIGL